MSSGQTWRCEADVLADLQFLSSRKPSLAGTQASAQLHKERQPTRLHEAYNPRAKKIEQIQLEDDDYEPVQQNGSTSPLGVAGVQEEVTRLLGAGRATRLEPYLSNLKRSFNENKLTKELQECGFVKENCNRDIIVNYQKTLVLTEGQTSDCEEDDTTYNSIDSTCNSVNSGNTNSNKKLSVAERLFGRGSLDI